MCESTLTLGAPPLESLTRRWFLEIQFFFCQTNKNETVLFHLVQRSRFFGFASVVFTGQNGSWAECGIDFRKTLNDCWTMEPSILSGFFVWVDNTYGILRVLDGAVETLVGSGRGWMYRRKITMFPPFINYNYEMFVWLQWYRTIESGISAGDIITIESLLKIPNLIQTQISKVQKQRHNIYHFHF